VKTFFLDTNVLLRLVAQDDARQLRQARAFIEKAVRFGGELRVPDLVIAELIWVLESSRKLQAVQIAQLVMSLVGDPRFTVTDEQLLARALELYSGRNVDFVDAYLAALALPHAGAAVASFDGDFKRLGAPWAHLSQERA
jgi:uncharacterized protein